VMGLLSDLGKPHRSALVLHELEVFGDRGLLDTGIAAASLSEFPRASLAPADAEAHKRVTEKMVAAHRDKIRALGESAKKTLWARALERVERWLDPMDSVRRRRRARGVMKELLAERISHARAALELRRLYERQKGGWLASENRGRPDHKNN